jgi:cytochrome c-type biogenesis protein CcmH
MFAIAATVLAVAAFAWKLRAQRRRARDMAPLDARVTESRRELRELERRLGADEITPEAWELERQRIAAALLAATPASAAPARPSPSYVAAAVVVAVLAAGAFQLWSTRGSESRETTVAAASSPENAASKPLRALSDEQLQRMVDEAGAKVKETPSDAAAWAMLAHSYDMLGKFAESSKAYATLARLMPEDAQVLADYADALAVAQGRTLAGEPTELVKKALAIDPANVKALALSGTAAYERADYAQAVSFWERALAASPDAAFRRQIESSIADARAAARGDGSGKTGDAAANAVPSGAAAAGPAVVAGRVTLADDLVAQAPPDATVYVFARPAQGSRMPVALTRLHVRDLPAEFSLDDASAMVPDARLSQQRTVVIGARISRRGDVMPQPGDMQGWSAPVPVGTRGLRLEISEVLK